LLRYDREAHKQAALGGKEAPAYHRDHKWYYFLRSDLIDTERGSCM
jgi:hypothetical protein